MPIADEPNFSRLEVERREAALCLMSLSAFVDAYCTEGREPAGVILLAFAEAYKLNTIRDLFRTEHARRIKAEFSFTIRASLWFAFRELGFSHETRAQLLFHTKEKKPI